MKFFDPLKKQKEEQEQLWEDEILQLMVVLAWWVDTRIDKVYVYYYNKKETVITFSFFYELDGKIYSWADIFDILELPIDEKKREYKTWIISAEEEAWDNVKNFLQENNFSVPVEIKVCFDVKTGKTEYNYSYRNYLDSEYFLYGAEKWMDELRIAHGQVPIGEYQDYYMQNDGTIVPYEKIPNATWLQTFSACLGKMTAIQYACGDYVVRNQDWNVDFRRGVISFGMDEYPIQFIGSESQSSDTWLWGWENINHLDNSLLQLVRDAKQKGEQLGLDVFTQVEPALNSIVSGHNLSVIVCGLQEPPVCYYCCPYDGGVAFVALSNVTDEVFAPVDVQKFMDITTQCIENHILDHRVFVESFLDWNKIAYDWDGQTLVAHFAQNLKIQFEKLDEYWRIEGLEVE